MRIDIMVTGEDYEKKDKLVNKFIDILNKLKFKIESYNWKDKGIQGSSHFIIAKTELQKK